MSLLTSCLEARTPHVYSPVLGKRNSSEISFDSTLLKSSQEYVARQGSGYSKRFKLLRSQFTPNHSGEIPVLSKQNPLQFSAKMVLSTLSQLEKNQVEASQRESEAAPLKMTSISAPKMITDGSSENKSAKPVEEKPVSQNSPEEEKFLKNAKLNPQSKSLFLLEKKLHQLIREEKIKEGKIARQEEKASIGNALALEKNSKRLKFINRTKTFVGKTVENQKSDQLRAFRFILNTVEESLKRGDLYYESNERILMQIKGIDSEDFEESKGVSICQVLDTLLRSEWGKKIIQKNPAEARKVFALLLNIQIADVKPRQTAALKFIDHHSMTLYAMINFIVDRQEMLFKANNGQFDEESLKKLGLPWESENDRDNLLEILQGQPDCLLAVCENALIPPAVFLNKWEKRLQSNLKAMSHGKENPRTIVKHQLELYRKKIKMLEKKIAMLNGNEELNQKKIEGLKKRIARLKKYHHQLSQAFHNRDLMGQMTNVFGMEQSELQQSNANVKSVLKKVVKQYLTIKLNDSCGENGRIKHYLKELERLTSVEDGALNYQKLGSLLNKIIAHCQSTHSMEAVSY